MALAIGSAATGIDPVPDLGAGPSGRSAIRRLCGHPQRHGTGITVGSNLRVFPAGEPVPYTSVVNYAPGLDKVNGTIVALPASGEVSLWSDASWTLQVIIEVVGYVAAPSSYVGMTPTRVLDTRDGVGHIGPIPGALAARTVCSVDLATGPAPGRHGRGAKRHGTSRLSPDGGRAARRGFSPPRQPALSHRLQPLPAPCVRTARPALPRRPAPSQGG